MNEQIRTEHDAEIYDCMFDMHFMSGFAVLHIMGENKTCEHDAHYCICVTVCCSLID